MNDHAPFRDPGYEVSAVRVIPRGRAVYVPATERPSVSVRHLLGYEPFTTMCANFGASPRDLASSITILGDVLRQHREAIHSRGVEAPAAVFLGNVLVGLREDASWVRYGDEFPSAGTEHHQYEVLHLLDLLMDSDETTYGRCVEMIGSWAGL
ncbi:hypothetical protein ITJ43_11685 [Microbacterium sp. VKM Ac-2870]|uniref:hypothetical protein n=1 Tax=Microbacterium sp. VKM Ac-2870 TaxID=2783825 RepID=UPI00188B4868|nr:hypothetical protein [Microbacterium sp. VKM Ac-2870]MBF4562801.1 hypothetical protein [Microbacterium sp. VKM Ac-2870]